MEQKVAVVTGSSRGIGRAIALALADDGMGVVVNYIKSDDKAKSTADEINAITQAIAVKADVADVIQVNQLLERTIESFGKVDVLINNAGVIERPADWENIDYPTWQRTLDVNLGGVFNCIRTFSPIFLKQEQGKIINIASTYGILGAAPVVSYTVAKAGVINMTKGFAKELAPFVNVNAVVPGNVDTDMTKSAGKELIDLIINSTPLKRLGTPEDIAHMVAFLASSKADFITGQTFIVDGGHMLA